MFLFLSQPRHRHLAYNTLTVNEIFIPTTGADFKQVTSKKFQLLLICYCLHRASVNSPESLYINKSHV